MRHLHLLAAFLLIAALAAAGCADIHDEETPPGVLEEPEAAGEPDEPLVPVEPALPPGFSLTPGPLGEMPAGKDFYISFMSVPISPDVTITLDGGPGLEHLDTIEATMYTSDGRILREYFRRPMRTQTSVVLTGTRYADRVKVTAFYRTGEEVVISDAMYGRGTAPDMVLETPRPVTPISEEVVPTPTPPPTPVATPIEPVPTPHQPERTPDPVVVPPTETIIPATPPPAPDSGYLITVSPEYATAYPGTDLDYSLTITAAPDFKEPVHLILHIDAVVTSLEYDLGRVNPPYPDTVVATVPIPSYLPGGIDVSGRVVGYGGGITQETAVVLGILGTGAGIQETVLFSGAAAGILIAGGVLGMSAAGVSSALASLQSSAQQVSPSSRPQWYAGQTTGIAWRKERGYTWSGEPGADGSVDPDLPQPDPDDDSDPPYGRDEE